MLIMSIFSAVHGNGLFFTIYTYVFAVLLFVEFCLVLFLNHSLIKISKDINNKSKQHNFLNDIISKYEKLLKRQRDIVNTEAFIDNYFLENNKVKVLIYRLLEKNEYIYFLAGLMGGFLVVLFSILAMDFDGIEGFQNLYSYLGNILFSLKPALFYFFSGIVFAIFSKMIFIIFSLKERIDLIKVKLNNYLENEIKYKYNRELKEIELFQELIKTLNNGFIRLEGVIEDSLADQIIELNEKIDRIINSRKEESELLRDVAVTEEEDDQAFPVR